MSGISWLNKGTLSLITGPMFSGKTEELIRRINVLKRANKKVLVFKPLIDNRYTYKNTLISHNNTQIEANLIFDLNSFKKILEKNENFDAIAIDEVQFLDISVFPIIKELIKKDKIVICSGLDKDYWNQYNSLLSHLLVYSDVVDKYFSICSKCNNIATHSQRIKDFKVVDYNHPKILIGGTGKYEPRCRKCFIEFDLNKYE